MTQDWSFQEIRHIVIRPRFFFQMASSPADERAAKIFLRKPPSSPGSVDGLSVIISDSDEPPTDPKEIQDLVKKYDLRHGDIIRYDDYRDGLTVIVKQSASGPSELIENPDDAAAGYLTIPADILESETDFRTKYKAMIEDCAQVNFHISYKDEFIQKLLGVEAPADWDYNVTYTFGDQEDEIWIRRPDGISHEFKTNGLTLRIVTDFFESQGERQEEIRLHVKLAGDNFIAYTDKYGIPGKSSGWLLAKPDLPPFWEIERGQMGGGMDESHWDWIATGPETSMTAAKDAIETFLDGFQFEYKWGTVGSQRHTTQW